MKIFYLLTIVFALALAASADPACVCTADYTPVCGASGRTYENRCRMKCAGDSFKYSGPCSSGGSDRIRF